MPEHAPAALPASQDAGGVSAPARPARLTPGARARALLVLGVLVFFAPALAGLGAFAYRDDGRMHGPHKRFIAERLSRLELPEWNPYGGLGFPLVAGGVDAVQHPLNALLVALPFHAGFTAWVIVSVILAALGAFAWARALGLGDPAATTAGLALAFSGFLVSSTDNVCFLTALASAPLLLAATHRFATSPSPGRAAGVALASGFMAAAGDPQSWGITLGLMAVQTVAFLPAPARSRAARAGAAVAVAVAAAAPFLLPILAWIPHSSRGDPLVWIEHERYNLLTVRLLELAVPGLFGLAPVRGPQALYHAISGNPITPQPWVLSEYVGVTVLALAAYGAARGRAAAALVAGAAAFAWAAMGRNAGFGQLAEHLPVLSGFRYWEKVAFFAALLLIAAAAHGVERWLAAPDRGGPLAGIAGAAAAAAFGLHVVCGAAPGLARAWLARPGKEAEVAELLENVAGGAAHAAVAAAALMALALLARRGRLAGRPLALAALALVALDLAAVNVHAYVLVPHARLQPASRFGARLAAEPERHRVVTPLPIPRAELTGVEPFEAEMLHGAALLYSGWNVDQRVGAFEPYTGMVPVRAMRFQLRTGYLHQLPQVGIWGVDHAVIPVDDALAGRVGVAVPQSVVDQDPTHRALLVAVPHRPRAYLAEEVVSVDRRGAMEFVLSPSSVSSSSTVVEGPVPAGLAPPRGSVRIQRSDPERVELAVEADRTALAVLNDSFAPGWSATVDGAPAEIVATNYLARGVFVGPGAHQLVFRYRTPLLGTGWLVACALALALAGWSLATRLRTSPTSRHNRRRP